MRHLRITYNSPAVLTFSLLCFIATILGVMTDGSITRQVFMTYHSPLSDPMTWPRFFTHVLGHASWEHLLGNISYILLLGPMLEEKYGSRSIILAILVTALVTGVINYVFFPTIALCGASGVVFAFILLASFTSFRDGSIPLTFVLVSIIFIGQQVYDGIFLQDNISNMAHIAGGVIGGGLGFALNKNR